MKTVLQLVATARTEILRIDWEQTLNNLKSDDYTKYAYIQTVKQFPALSIQNRLLFHGGVLQRRPRSLYDWCFIKEKPILSSVAQVLCFRTIRLTETLRHWVSHECAFLQ